MLTIDATKGGAAANSYATAAEADSYWDAVYGASEWADIDDDDKSRLLMTATKMIDKLTPKYNSADTSQALNFPVSTVVQTTDWFLDEVSNPDVPPDDGFNEVKEACIIQAFYLYQNSDTINEGVSMGIQGVKQETMGPSHKVITGFNPFRKYSPDVYRMLTPYLNLDFFTRRG